MEEDIKAITHYALLNEETQIVEGFYSDMTHSEIPKGSIPVDEELWQYILSLGQASVDREKLSKRVRNMSLDMEDEETCFGIEFSDCFSKRKRVVSKQIKGESTKVQEMECEINSLRLQIKQSNDKLESILKLLKK